MGCFKFPITLLKEIQGMIANFWWGNRGKRKIHWIFWNGLCESKLTGSLGFRQLQCFNLAMLAKQLWRLMTHPERLLSKVLRARYFPSGDVFFSTLGHRPSYTWRSIMAAHALFRTGCRWRVGLGLGRLVAARPQSFRPITLAPASLIDCNLITSIPLSCTTTTDLRIRHYSCNGLFTRKVWQAKIPNKVKVFVWRACHNALPTGKALSKRLHRFPEPCPLCRYQEEDVIHTLVHCSFARQVWGLAHFHIPYVSSALLGFWEWISTVSAQLDNADFWLLLCLCWFIWWCRNEMAMNGHCLDPPQVVCFAFQYLSSFLSQNSDDVVRAAPPSRAKWIAPALGHIKINFDGATFRNGRELGVGVVARGL
ncbi:UNVERIFIED_CONTAM: hypothetical protein Slati_1726700 [Sesamum latifolium]|uniref:Reverse transcriptase zinc-binding domain-containing protein n=1 Tax=Sesamum latifolium TaxID=2727402 RepID=A0AAW2WX16_9LAMI